jgi:LysM repeat protein
MIKRTLLTVFLAAAILIQPVQQKRAHACPDFTGVLVHCAAFQLIATFQAFYLANLRNPALGLSPLPGAGLPLPDYSLQPWADPANNDLMFQFILAVTGGKPLGSIDPDEEYDELHNRFARESFDRRTASASCGATGDCSSSPVGQLFGGGPNSGYLCDSGGAGCGNDLWNGLPQAGFGQCGPGGCGPTTALGPILPTNDPVGPYANNVTSGDIDPFGGGPTVFLDPDTGKVVYIGDDPKKWPERVQHADDLNSAYINGEIKFYPFSDPDWATKSVEDMKNSKRPPVNPQTAGGEIPIVGRGFGAVPYTPSAPAIRGANIPPPHEVKVNETLEDLAARYGVTVEQIKNANGLILDELTLGQTLQIPESLPEDNANRGVKYTDKAGRFGIGTDTSLGGAGGLPLRMQVAKNFGLQGIISYARVGFDPKPDNSDLTGYVGNVLVAIAGTGFAQPQSPVFPAPKTRQVTVTSDRLASAVTITRNQKPSDGRPVTLLPDPDKAAGSTEFVDAITDNVPKEFRLPTPAWNGKTIYNSPGGGKAVNFLTVKGARTAYEALTAGKPWTEAEAAGRATDRQLATNELTNTNVTTADGLASATSPGVRTSTPPPPTRPAGESIDVMEEALFKGSIYKLEIIKTPDGRTLAVGTGEHAGHVFGETKNGSFGWRREGPWTPPPAPAPFVGNQRPAIIVSPTPAASQGGRVVTTLPGKIEPGDKITVSELGRESRPGDGDSVRVSGNEGFDGDRDKGDTNDTEGSSAFQKAPISIPVKLNTADLDIRIGIANSDRDYMTAPGKKSFSPDDTVSFSSTGAKPRVVYNLSKRRALPFRIFCRSSRLKESCSAQSTTGWFSTNG